MKYSFCYTIKKIIKKDDFTSSSDTHLYIHNKNDEIEIICGPWRNTKEEAMKDEELYNKDKDAFFKMIKEQ